MRISNAPASPTQCKLPDSGGSDQRVDGEGIILEKSEERLLKLQSALDSRASEKNVSKNSNYTNSKSTGDPNK